MPPAGGVLKIYQTHRSNLMNKVFITHICNFLLYLRFLTLGYFTSELMMKVRGRALQEEIVSAP